MGRTRRLVCDCGGQITHPIPKNCPHCGARIASVRQRLWPLLLSLLLIVLMFALLVAYSWWSVAAGATDSGGEFHDGGVVRTAPCTGDFASLRCPWHSDE